MNFFIFMSTLNEQEIKSLNLGDKVELLWSCENKNYVTQDGQTPSVKSQGFPGLIVSRYKVSHTPAGGDYLAEKSCTYEGSIILGVTLAKDSTHYCLGPSNESVESQWHNKKVSRPIQFFKEV